MKNLFEKQNNFEPKEVNKMKKLTGILMIGLLAFGLVGAALAGNSDSHTLTISIPSIAEIAIVNGYVGGTKDIYLSVPNVAAGEQYLPDPGVTNDSLYVKYTVLTSATKEITAQMAGTLPTNLELKVSVADATGGLGTKGTGQSGVSLSDGGTHPVITGIGSCWTGTGDQDGARLTYTLTKTDPAIAPTSSTVLTITYTIINQP